MAKNKKSGKKKEERLSQMDLWEWTIYVVLLSVVFGTATYFYCRSYLLSKATEGNVPVGLALQFLLVLIIILVSTIFLGVVWKESRSNRDDRELLGHLEYIFKFIERMQDHMHQLGDTQIYENPHTIEWCSSVLKGSMALAKKLRIEREQIDAETAELKAKNIALEKDNEQLTQNRFRRSFLNIFRSLNNEPKIENSDEPLTVTELEEFLGNFIELTKRKTLEFMSNISKLEAQIAEQRTRHERALSDQVQVAEKKLESLKTEHTSVLDEARSQVQILKTERDIIQIAKDSSEQAHAEVVNGLNAQLLELNGRLEQASAECLRLQQESTESLTKQHAELQRRDELAQRQISDLNAEHVERLAELRKEISSLQGSLQIAQAAERNTTASAGLEFDRLRTEIADLRSQLDRLREEHSVILSEKDQIHQRAVAELTQSHAKQVELLEQQIVALQAEVKRVEDAVEERMDELRKAAEEEVGEADAKLEEANATVTQLQQQVEVLQAENASLQSNVTTAASNLERTIQSSMRRPVLPLRASSTSGCQSCRAHSQQIAQLRQQLVASREAAIDLATKVGEMDSLFMPAQDLNGANLVLVGVRPMLKTLREELSKLGG